jgi:membrane protease YdiL (CAAX protease family)
MTDGNSAFNAKSAAGVFGLAWFLPYCAYTLWNFGLLPLEAILSPFFGNVTYNRIWENAANYAVWLTLLAQLSIGIVLVARSHTLSWRALGFRCTTGLWFLLAITGLVSSYLFNGVLQAIFQLPVGGTALPQAGNGSPPIPVTAYSTGYLVSVLLIMGPATAVIEEVAFRGVLYGWLRSNMAPIAAMLLSSLVFGIVHVRFVNPGGLAGTSATLQVMLGGLLLAWFYEKSGSLWPSIYLHCVNNVIGVLQTLLPR